MEETQPPCHTRTGGPHAPRGRLTDRTLISVHVPPRNEYPAPEFSRAGAKQLLRGSLMTLRRFCPILLLCASIGIAANAQPAPALFAPVGGHVPPGVAAVASQRVEPDLELLAAAPAELRLDLPGAPPLFARLSALESRGPGDLTWRGTLLDEPGGGVTLTLENGYVVGLVTTRSAVWEIRTLSDGGQSVDRIEQDRFPACGTPPAPGPTTRLGDVDPCPDPEDGDRADVLAMYTPQARDAAGGVPQIEALIQAAVDNANTAFINSQMPLRFHLVGTALANHDDTGNSSTDLTWLINDSVTAALRDDLNADLVSLITEDGGGFCGRGQLPLTWGPGGNPDVGAPGDRAWMCGRQPDLRSRTRPQHGLGTRSRQREPPWVGDLSLPLRPLRRRLLPHGHVVLQPVLGRLPSRDPVVQPRRPLHGTAHGHHG